MARKKKGELEIGSTPLSRNIWERVKNDWPDSLEKLSKQAGISKIHIRQILRGVRDPSLSALQKIASALNVDFRILLDDPTLTPKHLETIEYVRKVKDPAILELIKGMAVVGMKPSEVKKGDEEK